MDIARIIREGREKLNLNQSQLAELVGVSPQAVQQWESGATQPRGKRLNKIAQVLKLPPTLMHFGAASETSGASGAMAGASRPGNAVAAAARAETALSLSDDNDPLISQVVEAMRRMSKEDAVRLVTISKALVGENVAQEARAAAEVGPKPLPVPDMAPHPPPAFPPRRMSESRSKTRGKTAVR